MLVLEFLVLAFLPASLANSQTSTLSFSPPAVTFGNQKILTATQPQYINISNPGTQSVTIQSISISGTNASDFSVETYCGSSIAAGANCSAYVIFEPSATGARTAVLSFSDTASGSPQTIALSGTGQAAILSLSVSPSFDFPAQNIGTTSSSWAAYIQNTGNTAISISSVSLSGANASDFAISSNNCGTAFPPNSNCNVNIVFTPSAAGNRSATLSLVDAAAGSPQTVALTGTGQPAVTLLQVSPSSGNFGTQILGAFSNLSFSLTNSGMVPINFTSLKITGTNASDFALFQNGCGSTLQNGYSCSLFVNFTPTAVGARAAVLTLVDNASGSPQSFALEGTGQAALATLSINPTALTFASLPLGQFNEQIIVINNTGTEIVNISSAKISGINPGDFTVNQCGSISPSGSCYLQVNFNPTAVGPRSATLTLADNASGSPQAIQLAGTATAGASLSFSPASMNFGTVKLGATASQTITVTNTSKVAATFGSAAELVGGDVSDFTITANSCPFYSTLASGATCSITISFSPREPGARATALELNDTAASSPQVLFVGGNGGAISRTLAFSNLLIRFNGQVVGTTSLPGSVIATNTGNMAVDLTSVTIGGTNASDFAITSGPCSVTVFGLSASASNVIPPGAACTITITFTPGAAGPRNASLIFKGDQTGSPQGIQLSGSGAASGTITANPAELAYGGQPVGLTSSYQNVYIQNAGTTSINLSSITVQGTNAADFSINTSSLIYYQILPGQSGSIGVAFTPSAPGTRTAKLTIADGSSTPSTVLLTGTGLALSKSLTIDNTLNFFGAQTVGTAGLQFTTTLQNTGASNIDLKSFNITGADASDFSVTSNSCPYFYSSLPPGQNCQLIVGFNPAAAGVRTAALNIVSDAANSPLTVSLNGYGVNGAAIPLSAFPRTLNFSSGLGVESAEQAVTLVNTGSEGIAVTPAILGSPDFSANGPYCASRSNSIVPPGAACTVYVYYTPSGLGSRTATLALGSAAVSLNGTGQNPLATLSIPASVNFNGQGAGIKSLPLAVTIQNTGNEAVTVTGFAINGTNSADFTLDSNSCQYSIQPGQSCVAAVTFTPSATGARTATLAITDSATGSPQKVTLSGTGQATQKIISFSTPGLSFGPTNLAATVTLPMVVTNTGSATVNLSGYTLSGTNAGDFAISQNTCSSSDSNALPAGAKCTITVAFKPAAAGVRTAMLQIADDASGSPQSVPIDGPGQAVSAILVLSPGSVNFAGVGVGYQGIQEVYVTNTGDAAAAFTNFTLTGTNAADFKISWSTCKAAGVPAQTTCTTTLSFAPSAAGLRSATLTLNGAASGSQSVTLVGLGETAAKSVAVARPAYDFGVSNVGTPLTSAPLSILNTGTASVTFASFTLAGSNAADFTITGNTCSALPNILPAGNGSLCSLTVMFKPSASGVRTALLSFADDAPGSPQTITLIGVGQSITKSVALSPAAYDFGVSSVGTSQANSFFILNSGTGSVTVSKVGISGANAADFTISTNYCSTPSNVIQVSRNCFINLSFNPAAAGVRTALLSITDDAGTGLQTIPLTGTGQAVNPKVTISQTILPFTSPIGVPVNNSVVFTNVGMGAAPFTNSTISGPNAADFSLSTYCPSTGSAGLPTGQSCALYVTFKPTVAGSETATLSITAGTAVTISLTGVGQSLQQAILFSTPFELFAGQIGSGGGSQGVSLGSVGTGQVTLSSVAITGANAADFSLDTYQGCITGTLLSSSGNPCYVIVDYTPGATVFPTANLQIKDSASGTAQNILLAGVSEVAGQSLLGTATSFPEEPVGTATGPVPVYFTNYVSNNITPMAPKIGGTNAADYSITSTTCGSTWTEFQTCIVNVAFKPTAAGVRLGAVQMGYSGGTGTAANALLGGYGMAGKGFLVVNPLALEFNATNIDTTDSSFQSLQLTNTGAGSINFGQLTFSGTNGADFTIHPGSGSNACGVSLEADADCTLLVQFTPSAVGLRSGILQINSDATNTGQMISLVGVGQTAAELLYTSQPSLDLGTQNVNGGSSTAYVSLQAGGTSGISLSAFQITGTNAADFTISSTSCGTQLSLTGTCEFQLLFTPTATGERTASLSISSDAPNSPLTIPLTGLGQSTSLVMIMDKATVDFGPASVSTLSTTTINLRNQGSATVQFGVPTITGTNAADFSITNNTCGLVTSGDYCAIGLSFVPSAAGERAATLTINDDAVGSPQTVPLFGTGQTVSHLLTASTNTVNMGAQSTGLLSASIAIQISNTGTSPVTLSGITISGTNAADFAVAAPATGSCAASIPAGTMCAVNIQFLPSVAGPEIATLTIASNSSAGPLLVTLLGEGQKAAAQLSASATALSLPDTKVGGYSNASFTLTNTGNTSVGVYAPVVTGAAANNFYIPGTCSQVLAPGASCVETVSFLPVTSGVSAATLQISSTAGSAPITVSLAGIGN